MSYRNEKFGHELWHSFFTAALTGLTSAAYDKKDFMHDGQYDLHDVRENVIDEAFFIADGAMEFVITRSAYGSAYNEADELLAKKEEKRRKENAPFIEAKLRKYFDE